MEANVRLGWADVIVHRDFMGRYVKWDSVIHMVPVSMTAHALVTCKDPIVNANLLSQVKFVYSEWATKFCEIFTLPLSYVVPVKSKVEIFQNFMAFSEYVNFNGMQQLPIYQNLHTIVSTQTMH